MVQIPEYTRRENAQPMQRGGMNLQLPDALTRGTNFEPAKKALKLSGELAEAFVAMKDRRDTGIASAFTNQYNKDSTQKILELQQQYQGQNAKRIMPEFQKWRDEYISEYSVYDPDSAKEGRIYLENEAQNRIAREKLDAYNVRDINSLSAYIAKEEETFRVNNINAEIEDNVTKLSVDFDLVENAPITKAAIRANVALLHPGQSKKFIDKKAQALLEAAEQSNILRNVQTDPFSSIVRYNNKEFRADMTPDTLAKTKKDIVSAVKNYMSQSMAEDLAYNRTPQYTLNDVLSDPFFDDVDRDALKNEINNEAVKRSKDIATTQHENSVFARNSILSKVDVRLGNYDLDSLSDKDMASLVSFAGGLQDLNTINYIRTNRSNELYNISNGNPVQEMTSNDYKRFFAALEKINNGAYRTFGDMYNDIQGLPATATDQLGGYMLAQIKYNIDVENLKNKNKFDVDKTIKSTYENYSGMSANDGDSSYRIYKTEVAKQLQNLQLTGQQITEDSIAEVGHSVYRTITNPKDDMSQIRKLIFDLKKKRIAEKQPGVTQDEEKLREWAYDLVDDTDMDDVFSKSMMERFADRIVIGDVDGAYLMLTEARKNHEAYLRRKAAESDERMRKIINKPFFQRFTEGLAYDFSGGDVNYLTLQEE